MADGGADVVGEDHEGAAEGTQAHQRETVHHRAHAEFADAVVEVIAAEIAGGDGCGAFSFGQVAAGQVGGAADEGGDSGNKCVKHHLGGLAGGNGFHSREVGQGVLPAIRKFALQESVKFGGFLGVGAAVGGKVFLPLVFRFCASGFDFIEAGLRFVGDVEEFFGVKAEKGFGLCHAFVTEWGAVHFICTCFGAAVADGRAAGD